MTAIEWKQRLKRVGYTMNQIMAFNGVAELEAEWDRMVGELIAQAKSDEFALVEAIQHFEKKVAESDFATVYEIVSQPTACACLGCPLTPFGRGNHCRCVINWRAAEECRKARINEELK